MYVCMYYVLHFWSIFFVYHIFSLCSSYDLNLRFQKCSYFLSEYKKNQLKISYKNVNVPCNQKNKRKAKEFFVICLRVCVFAALFPWRHAAQQPAPAADLPEVRRRQLRHRLRRLPHLHRPSGEHVQYVTPSQAEVWSEMLKPNLISRLCQEPSRLWTHPRGDAWTWTSCR